MNSMAEPIIMVDVSYYEKYSANAVWRKIKDDHGLNDDENFDPMTIPDFVAGLSWHFDCGLDEIIGKHHPIHSGSNYVFCMDSVRSDIWRKQIFSGYKHKRDFVKHRFNWQSINDWTEHWVKNHCSSRHSRYLKINGLEADDIFSIISKHIIEKYPELDIVIVSGDSDLLQLGNNSTIQIDSHGDIITIEDRLKKDGVSFNPNVENYLQYKILIGDTSDDIPSVKRGKCGPKFAARLINDKKLMVEFIKSDKQITENFILNANLIDLKNTPKMLCESVMRKWMEFDEEK